MDEQAVESSESKTQGKWWAGAIAGIVIDLGALILFIISTLDHKWDWDELLLDFGVVIIGGFIFGSLGGLIARRWGTIPAIILGGIFGVLAIFLEWLFLYFYWTVNCC